jgi:hypothetical protein
MLSDTQVSRAVAVRRRRYPHEAHGRIWLAMVAAMIVASAGAAYGIRGATQASRSQTHIATLQSQVASLQERIAADERTAAGERRTLRTVAARAGEVQRSLQRVNWALQSVPSQAQLASVRNGLAAYAGCVPELQREIAGLRLTWRIDPAKPAGDSFTLFSAAPVSASCAAALAER